jgi:hypothetical protein
MPGSCGRDDVSLASIVTPLTRLKMKLRYA